MIYLLYATKVNVGGWTTFTRHLYDSLVDQGHHVCVVKLGNRDEPFGRPFGEGYIYHNVTIELLQRQLKLGEQVIITALGKHYVEQSEQLIKAGARVVCHDPAEPAFRMNLRSPWVIRKAMLKHLPHATFIRHPYVRQQQGGHLSRGKRILATSRVDFDKNTAMILDANRLGAKIDIVGYENRLYTKFKIIPSYPEYEQTSGNRRALYGYEKTMSSFQMLQGALAMVDLTDIKGDGGGTQYTFLEAWDAGAIPIIGNWWLRKGDDMREGVNCVAVLDANHLSVVVKQLKRGAFNDKSIIAAGERHLVKHSPKIIVPQVMEWFNAR